MAGRSRIDKERVRKMFEKGISDKVMARRLKCCPRNIVRIRLKEELIRPLVGNKKGRKGAYLYDRKKIRQMLYKKQDPLKIAAKVGCDPATVYKIRKDIYGRQTKKHEPIPEDAPLTHKYFDYAGQVRAAIEKGEVRV